MHVNALKWLTPHCVGIHKKRRALALLQLLPSRWTADVPLLLITHKHVLRLMNANQRSEVIKRKRCIIIPFCFRSDHWPVFSLSGHLMVQCRSAPWGRQTENRSLLIHPRTVKRLMKWFREAPLSYLNGEHVILRGGTFKLHRNIWE